MTSDLHPLDAATQTKPISANHFLGRPHPLYQNFAGPFGGATAATLLRVVLEDPQRQGDPAALTVNFCGPIKSEDYEITTRLVRGGRTAQHWSVELTQKGMIVATASIVMIQRKPSWSLAAHKMPEVPPLETLPETNWMPLEWTKRYMFRFSEGDLKQPAVRKAGDLEPSRSVLWLQDNPPRPLDFLSLAALSDAFFLRFIHVRGIMTASGTVTLTTYFHVSTDELAQLGTVPVLAVADTATFHNTVHDQSCAIWSQGGQLLVNGVQIVWYKD